MKKKGFIFMLIFVFMLVSVAPCFAATYSNSWNITQTGWTYWGIKGFPYKLEVREVTTTVQSGFITANNHQANVFYYPKYYAASELWFTVSVKANYKQGSNLVGSVNNNEWIKGTWLLPTGQAHNGGTNTKAINLTTSTSRKAEYVTTVSAYQVLLSDTKTLSI